MIIGFIVMCYCVLRNVEVPLNFSSQTSFTDKLTQLGQYAIDNATDDLKNFLYSVYTYCDDNGITSVLGLSKFLVTQAGLFFNSISKWIGGSFVYNPSDTATGLLNHFIDNPLSTFENYEYNGSFATVFNNVSDVLYSNTLGVYTGYRQGVYIFAHSMPAYDPNRILVLSPEYLCVYDVSGDIATKSSAQFVLYQFSYTPYYQGYNYLSPPSLGSYSAPFLYQSTNSWRFNMADGFAIDELLFGNFLSHVPFNVYLSDSTPQSLNVSILNPYKINVLADILNPAVDNVYVPTNEWWLDIAGTWESIAAGQAQIIDQTDRIAAFVGSIPLTLTAADSYAPTIGDAGNYVFPDFGSVWKYPQYFFDTLSGWGMFVGNCLRAVTVDEGGLSWIFYGGFVLLVCGGIIGKILMG